MLRLVASHPLHGVMMSIQEMSLPTAVQVHGIRGLNPSHLQLYFESPENGGEALIDFRETENEDCVIVQYQSSDGMYRYYTCMCTGTVNGGWTTETVKVKVS